MGVARGGQGTHWSQDARFVAPRDTHCPQQRPPCHPGRVPASSHPQQPRMVCPLHLVFECPQKGLPSVLVGELAPCPGGVGSICGRGTSRLPEAATGAQRGTTSALGGSERNAPTVGLCQELWNQEAQAGRLHLHDTQRGGPALRGWPSTDACPLLPAPSSQCPPHLRVPVPTARGWVEGGGTPDLQAVATVRLAILRFLF